MTDLDDLDEPAKPLPVGVFVARAREVVAIVDGVTVTIRTRRRGLPRWRCAAHYDPAGRTSCEHIEALAATVPEPDHLAAIRGRDTREGRRNP